MPKYETTMVPGSARHDPTQYQTKMGVMDKPTAINYPKWRKSFILLLRSINALRIVQSEETEPTPGSTPSATTVAKRNKSGRTYVRNGQGKILREVSNLERTGVEGYRGVSVYRNIPREAKGKDEDQRLYLKSERVN
jgi:hypothetical protein